MFSLSALSRAQPLVRLGSGGGRWMASAATPSVPIPLTLHGLDGRYATALYTAAMKKNQLDAVDGELKRIAQIIQRDPVLKEFLASPILSREQKSAGVRQMLTGKYSELTTNFFEVLAENRRLDETSKILDAFQQLMAAHRNEVTVVVTTAKPLNAKLEQQLKNVLSKSKLVSGQSTVRVTSKINSALLGGLIVEVGDKTIDLSVASRLAKLNRALTDHI